MECLLVTSQFEELRCLLMRCLIAKEVVLMGEEAENQLRILVLMLMQCQRRNKMNSKGRMQVLTKFCKVGG
jgi:hypothetical protein